MSRRRNIGGIVLFGLVIANLSRSTTWYWLVVDTACLLVAAVNITARDA